MVAQPLRDRMNIIPVQSSDMRIRWTDFTRQEYRDTYYENESGELIAIPIRTPFSDEDEFFESHENHIRLRSLGRRNFRLVLEQGMRGYMETRIDWTKGWIIIALKNGLIQEKGIELHPYDVERVRNREPGRHILQATMIIQGGRHHIDLYETQVQERFYILEGDLPSLTTTGPGDSNRITVIGMEAAPQLLTFPKILPGQSRVEKEMAAAYRANILHDSENHTIEIQRKHNEILLQILPPTTIPTSNPFRSLKPPPTIGAQVNGRTMRAIIECKGRIGEVLPNMLLAFNGEQRTVDLRVKEVMERPRLAMVDSELILDGGGPVPNTALTLRYSSDVPRGCKILDIECDEELERVSAKTVCWDRGYAVWKHNARDTLLFDDGTDFLRFPGSVILEISGQDLLELREWRNGHPEKLRNVIQHGQIVPMTFELINNTGPTMLFRARPYRKPEENPIMIGAVFIDEPAAEDDEEENSPYDDENELPPRVAKDVENIEPLELMSRHGICGFTAWIERIEQKVHFEWNEFAKSKNKWLRNERRHRLHLLAVDTEDMILWLYDHRGQVETKFEEVAGIEKRNGFFAVFVKEVTGLHTEHNRFLNNIYDRVECLYTNLQSYLQVKDEAEGLEKMLTWPSLFRPCENAASSKEGGVELGYEKLNSAAILNVTDENEAQAKSGRSPAMSQQTNHVSSPSPTTSPCHETFNKRHGPAHRSTEGAKSVPHPFTFSFPRLISRKDGRKVNSNASVATKPKIAPSCWKIENGIDQASHHAATTSTRVSSPGAVVNCTSLLRVHSENVPQFNSYPKSTSSIPKQYQATLRTTRLIPRIEITPTDGIYPYTLAPTFPGTRLRSTSAQADENSSKGKVIRRGVCLNGSPPCAQSLHFSNSSLTLTIPPSLSQTISQTPINEYFPSCLPQGIKMDENPGRVRYNISKNLSNTRQGADVGNANASVPERPETPVILRRNHPSHNMLEPSVPRQSSILEMLVPLNTLPNSTTLPIRNLQYNSRVSPLERATYAREANELGREVLEQGSVNREFLMAAPISRIATAKDVDRTVAQEILVVDPVFHANDSHGNPKVVRSSFARIQLMNATSPIAEPLLTKKGLAQNFILSSEHISPSSLPSDYRNLPNSPHRLADPADDDFNTFVDLPPTSSRVREGKAVLQRGIHTTHRVDYSLLRRIVFRASTYILTNTLNDLGYDSALHPAMIAKVVELIEREQDGIFDYLPSIHPNEVIEPENQLNYLARRCIVPALGEGGEGIVSRLIPDPTRIIGWTSGGEGPESMENTAFRSVGAELGYRHGIVGLCSERELALVPDWRKRLDLIMRISFIRADRRHESTLATFLPNYDHLYESFRYLTRNDNPLTTVTAGIPMAIKVQPQFSALPCNPRIVYSDMSRTIPVYIRINKHKNIRLYDWPVLNGHAPIRAPFVEDRDHQDQIGNFNDGLYIHYSPTTQPGGNRVFYTDANSDSDDLDDDDRDEKMDYKKDPMDRELPPYTLLPCSIDAAEIYEQSSSLPRPVKPTADPVPTPLTVSIVAHKPQLADFNTPNNPQQHGRRSSHPIKTIDTNPWGSDTEDGEMINHSDAEPPSPTPSVDEIEAAASMALTASTLR